MHPSAVTAVTVVMLCCGYAHNLQASEARPRGPVSSSAANHDNILHPHVIYGDDDRIELFEMADDDAMRRAADSTAALVNLDQLTEAADEPAYPKQRPAYRQLAATKFGDMYNLCQDEPFREQPSPAFCSGFLVAPDLVVTAGHCVLSESDCQNIAFIFGFGYAAAGQDVTRVASENIYSCKTVVKRQMDILTESDFAVVRLDRAVQGRAPLTFRQSGKIESGAPLVVIGHPAGLPTKIAGGAAVRSSESAAFFTANLDTYGGNSGSAVFNAATGDVEGLLVRGEQDFTTREGCLVSNRCDDGACRGEDVVRATEFAPYVVPRTATNRQPR